MNSFVMLTFKHQKYIKETRVKFWAVIKILLFEVLQKVHGTMYHERITHVFPFFCTKINLYLISFNINYLQGELVIYKSELQSKIEGRREREWVRERDRIFYPLVLSPNVPSARADSGKSRSKEIHPGLHCGCRGSGLHLSSPVFLGAPAGI